MAVATGPIDQRGIPTPGGGASAGAGGLIGPGLRILQRHLWVYRRTWRGSIFTSFLNPVLFMIAMGFGVGSLIGPGGGAGVVIPAGLTYLAFIAPGLMAGGAMQTATFESSFPISARIMWWRNYEAMLATPLRTWDLLVGEFGWIGFRLLTTATAFLIVMFIFGIPSGPLAILAIPAAMLTGFAFSPIMISIAARITGDPAATYSMIFRFVIMPLFLFSGTFFPIERLPEVLQVVAWVTPLYNGVALTRDLVLGLADPLISLAHLAILLVYASIGLYLARRNLYRRMVV
ncbi:MAG TPA: ABC transporter permease [Candidatus Limnocylindrales bacterium]